MTQLRLLFVGCLIALAFTAQAVGQTGALPPKSKIYVDPMYGFGTDLVAAIIGGNVPLVIVTDPQDADLLINGQTQVVSRSSYSSVKVDEATLTVMDVRGGTVVDAFTVTADTTQKLARACAARLNDHIQRPQPAPPPPPTPAVAVTPTPAVAPPPILAVAEHSTGTARVFVQGEVNRLADFTETLRSELRAVGISVRVVQRGDEYDYNVIFVQTQAHSGAIVLDRQGLLVASALDTAIRAKGATDGAARKLARQLASFKGN